MTCAAEDLPGRETTASLPGAVHREDHAVWIDNTDLGRQGVDDSNRYVVFYEGGAHLRSREKKCAFRHRSFRERNNY
jgi:hypothetical protein